ncbi:cytohesin-4 [Haliaeetus albicilla]|uniref:cytohesin-4 n=1 Tax=Haliaeetus albicilla TaxID=8969 RepID=UPI00052265C9|nr:PREDICTED: cytohesin-4 [Haliaeetus albicilla]XP_010583727.1 PREDICTED: cytohesin-4 [Haliaeetus leucocephalus]
MDFCPAGSTDLSEAEEAEIETIRQHRQELLEDIKKLKEEIAQVFAEIECFQNAEKRKEADNNPGEQTSKLSQKDKLSLGRKKFNMDPAKGIQYLIEQQVLSSDLQEIAKFLHKGEGLNKTAIGDYLGGRDPTNIQILQAFVACHQFANLNLVQALRQFLWSFRLPGEAQKIDRMMEAFANWYCKCNPGVFQSTDTCYILSFSIIMLNTSLHNPNVKDKTPFERFVSINKGIDNGEDLPEELLKNLFESIKNEPFSIPEDDGNDLTHTFFNPNREGWLLKLGGRVKTWKRRWFILTDNCLYYFEYTTDKEPLGIIPLENLSVQKVDDPKKPNCFELFNPKCKGQKIKACKTDGDGKVVEGKHQSYKISAATPAERDEWIEAIRTSITQDPFYDLVSARKKKIASKN